MTQFIMLQIVLLCSLGACTASMANDGDIDLATAPADQSYTLKSFPIPVEILEARAGPLPNIVKASGKDQLAYELNLANSFRYPLKLTKIEMVDPAHPDVSLHSFNAAYLKKNIQRPGLNSTENALILKGNQYGVAYLRFNLPDNDKPKELFHRLHLEVLIPNKEPRELLLELARIEVPAISDLSIAPPVSGGPWLYESEPHWVDRELTEGRPSNAQRYAIDFVKLDDAGNLYNDKQGTNQKYVTYAEPVLAVAAGRIIAVKDGIAENDPVTGEMAVKGSRETIAGNYVMLDIGNDVVAVYGHLRPGSLTVKTGDKVAEGAVLGKIGNSGNSDLPHLHFHLESRTHRNLTMSGDGVAFQFRAFNQAASYTVTQIGEAYETGKIDARSFVTDERENEFPDENGVIIFD